MSDSIFKNLTLADAQGFMNAIWGSVLMSAQQKNNAVEQNPSVHVPLGHIWHAC